MPVEVRRSITRALYMLTTIRVCVYSYVYAVWSYMCMDMMYMCMHVGTYVCICKLL